jgi:hypothetical protein
MESKRLLVGGGGVVSAAVLQEDEDDAETMEAKDGGVNAEAGVLSLGDAIRMAARVFMT